MKLPFTKYHGTGNDFILVDNRELQWTASPAEIASLCHRHFGIGADGLMLLSAHPDFDFAMTYFNSDGAESTMCGNGGRCITAFARSLGLIDREAKFLAVDGPHDAVILDAGMKECRVALKMKDTMIGSVMNDGIFLDTGSPHFVSVRGDISDTDVVREGRSLRNNVRFSPGGSNINFAEIRENGLFVRTYERGVEDETLSCGTGVTAAALVAAFLHPANPGFFRVDTLGGTLRVSFRQKEGKFTDIWLEGPARRVFEGIVISE